MVTRRCSKPARAWHGFLPCVAATLLGLAPPARQLCAGEAPAASARETAPADRAFVGDHKESPAGRDPLGPDEEAISLSLELDAEMDSLNRLKSELDTLERMFAAERDRERRMPIERREHEARTLSGSRLVEKSGLRVERTEVDDGFLYSVSADNQHVERVLAAIADAAERRLSLDVSVARERLAARVTIHRGQTDLHELLQIATGLIGLDCSVEEAEIFVAPADRIAACPLWQHLGTRGLELYETALLRSPDRAGAPRAYLGIAKYYQRLRLYKVAIQSARTVLERFPETPERKQALLLVGDCLRSVGDGESAVAVYLRYVDAFPRAPDAPDVYLHIGNTWLRHAKYHEAARAYGEIVNQWPRSKNAPEAQVGRIRAYLAAEEYRSAVIEADRFLRLFRGHAHSQEVLLYRGRSLHRLREYRRARLALAKCLACAGVSCAAGADADRLAEHAYYLIGDCFFAEGRVLEALEAYTGALEEFPSGAWRVRGRHAVARCYMKMGLYDRAAESVKKGMAALRMPGSVTGQSPSRDEMAATLAECLLAQQQYGRAASLFESVLSRESRGSVSFTDSGASSGALESGAVRPGCYAGAAAESAAEALLAEQKFDEAALQFARAAGLSTDDETPSGDVGRRTRLLRRAAKCYIRAGQLERAAQAYCGKIDVQDKDHAN